MMRLLLVICMAISSNCYGQFDPLLINGRPAGKGEFPEVVYISTGYSKCSAAVVGKRVVLTAAHCVDRNGQKIKFQLSQRLHRAVCYITKNYEKTEYTHDIALCKTEAPMDVRPAKLAKAGPPKGAKVDILGYGCTRESGHGGNDGILRVGTAPVTKLPARFGGWVWTTSETRLCYGDSGGPAYYQGLVFGVNSRGDLRSLSLLAATYLPESKEFMSHFAKSQGVQICGVNDACEDKPKYRDSRRCRRKQRKLKKYQARLEKQCKI